MIVVALGHRLTEPSIHPHLRGRVDTAVDALRSTGASSLLCSGGRRNEGVDRSESSVMRDHARDRGVPANRILTESRSVDTIGNAYFTRCLLDRCGVDPEAITLVTAASHVERAAFAFEQCFGDVDIDTAFVFEPTRSDDDPHGESRDRMERTRAFFDPVASGDREAIAGRLVDEHDCYGPADVPDAPPSLRSA